MWVAGPDARLCSVLWQVTCKLLKAEPACHFLIVQDVAVLALLLEFHLPQLAFLNLLNFTHSLIQLRLALSLNQLDLLVHLLLVSLSIEDAPVAVLQLILVHSLLLGLLCGSGALLLVLLPLHLLELLLCLLLLHSEVGHVLLVDLSLLVKRSILLS